MGVFYEASDSNEQIRRVVKDALAARPALAEDAEAVEHNASAAVKAVKSSSQLDVGRLLIAIAILAVIVGAAVGTDAANLDDLSSKALWALASSVFGVILGLLGGEKTG
jgi:hypothetical protein